MSKETTDAGKKGDWQGLLATLAANMVALAHLEPLRALLAKQLDRVVEIHQQQSGLVAGKQELSKQLRVETTEGDRLATLLRSAIKQHYGIRTEKVAEFGVQPFRGRPRKTKAELATGTPSPTTPPPAVPASTSK
ncbi:MAG: hypothetical protein QOF89_1798 [Acidobacteriota bacterium]|jgi:hypothetical protein|nr:hypothetical protein [Acidobacteriota bacterium]